MMMENQFKGKKVLVMGLGLHGGGVGTVRFLADAGADITVTDLRSEEALKPSLEALKKIPNIRYVLGKHREEDFLNTDLIVKNPGVAPDSPYLLAAERKGVPVTSDVGIFFHSAPAGIIGVTGTRGKSTTAYLIHAFLKTKMSRVFLAGNIRKSVLEILPELQKDDLVVLELSSFQLEDLFREKKSPRIAVITNIQQDHLNWHRTTEAYREAKSNIFRFQKGDDYLFIDHDNEVVQDLAKEARSQIVNCRLPSGLHSIVDSNLGVHYRVAVGLAVAVATHFGVGDEDIEKILKDFHGLEGRQQEIAVVRGVHFINDTTSTTPDAAVAAIERFSALKAGGKLILIAGGQDKGLDFEEMAAAIKQWVDVLVLLPGTASEILAQELNLTKSDFVRLSEVRSMQEAVRMAFELAQKDDWIVLSPGAASFGLFLNEFDRGDQFISSVKNLSSSQDLIYKVLR